MGDFDDLLAANREFADDFDLGGFDGIAHAGVAIVTCMDSRHRPAGHGRPQARRRQDLPQPGRPGHRAALEALVLGVHLLGVERILVVPHTRCAMTASTEQELRDQIGESAGAGRRLAALQRRRGPAGRARGGRRSKVRTHPLIPESVLVGGFMYDVDTGLLDQKF